MNSKLKSLINLLKLPEVKQIKNLDSLVTNELHREIILQKEFLKNLYIDFYKEFQSYIKYLPKGHLIEIGSGSGFIKKIIPNVITSDIVPIPDIDAVFSATELPFDKNLVSAIFMLDTLHHIKTPYLFFKEAERCLIKGGKVIMIEPQNSLWGSFIYKHFHDEPFEVNAGWEIKQNGRLSGANLALPWIIFFRDRKTFQDSFPNLRINRLRSHTPFCYLLSGGVSFRQFLPTFTYELVKGFERLISPLNDFLGMFVTIELEKL